MQFVQTIKQTAGTPPTFVSSSTNLTVTNATGSPLSLDLLVVQSKSSSTEFTHGSGNSRPDFFADADWKATVRVTNLASGASADEGIVNQGSRLNGNDQVFLTYATAAQNGSFTAPPFAGLYAGTMAVLDANGNSTSTAVSVNGFIDIFGQSRFQSSSSLLYAGDSFAVISFSLSNDGMVTDGALGYATPLDVKSFDQTSTFRWSPMTATAFLYPIDTPYNGPRTPYGPGLVLQLQRTTSL